MSKSAPSTMKAVALTRRLPVSDPECLTDVVLPVPALRARDLLIEVRAVSVNPVDAKVRNGTSPPPASPQVLGWDVAGVVRAVGNEVTSYRVGDEVYGAGDITRPGTNSELCAMDERIVGRKPRNATFAEAAAVPLTALTAYEALLQRLKIARGTASRGQRLLVIGGAGGVGSMAIQLAKALTGVTVIATASRPESVAWAKSLGADVVIDHNAPLAPQLAAHEMPLVDFVLCTADTDPYFAGLAEIAAPQSSLCFLVPNKEPVNLAPFYAKSVAFHWELMFTRSMFQTADMDEQRRILNEVAGLLDEGRLKTTLRANGGTISAQNLRAAHAQIESGTTLGKLVLEGWG